MIVVWAMMASTPVTVSEQFHRAAINHEAADAIRA